MEEGIEWSARIDQALEEYPEVQEYLGVVRGNIEALADRLEAARELHRPSRGHNPECHCGIPPNADRSCAECRNPFPCPTIKALEGDQ